MHYITVTTSPVFYVGMCLYISEMVNDLRRTINALDGTMDSSTIMRHLFQEIHFHNELLEYSSFDFRILVISNILFPLNFSKIPVSLEFFYFFSRFFSTKLPSLAKSVGRIMSVGLFFQLLICAVSMAVYMYGIETNSLLGRCVSVTGLTNVLISTYIYCLLSENITRDLSAIGDIFYDCIWYQLPVKHQKLFSVPIQRGQTEYRMTGLGLVECSLRSFTTVSSIFSWFVNYLLLNKFISFSQIIRAAGSYFLIMHRSK